MLNEMVSRSAHTPVSSIRMYLIIYEMIRNFPLVLMISMVLLKCLLELMVIHMITKESTIFLVMRLQIRNLPTKITNIINSNHSENILHFAYCVYNKVKQKPNIRVTTLIKG